jgi:hypothetical protein
MGLVHRNHPVFGFCSVKPYISALVLFGLFGCASTQTASDATKFPAEAYAPLRVGASYTYEVTFPGQQGTMEVRTVEQKDGFFLDNRQGTFKHTSDGLRDRQRYLIRYPLTPDHRWKAVVSPSAIEHYRIRSVGEPCESAAGSFQDCLVVESSLRRGKEMTLYVEWTWARGVGLVKVETEADIPGQGRIPQTKQSLLRFSSPDADTDASPWGPQGEDATQGSL